MINVYSYHNLYHLCVGAHNVLLVDNFRLACYSDFLGVPPKFFKVQKRRTSIVNLESSMDNILSAMKSNTRNEIRRAIRDNYIFETTKDTKYFVSFYNSFAQQKGLDKISQKDITKYQDIILSLARLGNDILSMHATIIDKMRKKAFLLYSASSRFSNIGMCKQIGISNRFLHFKDLEFFKDEGLLLYDFSGVSENIEEPEKYKIGLFKKGFGGEMIDTVTVYSPIMSLLMKFKK